MPDPLTAPLTSRGSGTARGWVSPLCSTVSAGCVMVPNALVISSGRIAAQRVWVLPPRWGYILLWPWTDARTR